MEIILYILWLLLAFSMGWFFGVRNTNNMWHKEVGLNIAALIKETEALNQTP